MKRWQRIERRNKRIFIGLFILTVLVIWFVKPKDAGEPYSDYFANLNSELKKSGTGRPIVLLDLDKLDGNLAALRKNLTPPLHYRVVVKSLPSVDLLRYVVRSTGTKRLMVFHSGDIVMLQNDNEFRTYDTLLGKPMPINALKDIYSQTSAGSVGNIRWLVDTEKRLIEYLDFAKTKQIRLKIVFEIDVGLHRGGYANFSELLSSLRLVETNPAFLKFSGFMGYEPHVASVPVIFADKSEAIESALTDSLHKYADFVSQTKQDFPSFMNQSDIVFNGGGSKTYRFYQDAKNSIVNDVSVGSALVKPTDFDVVTLSDHDAAVYLATPVLKRLEGTQIPFLEKFSFLFPLWNPNQQLTYFIYGGAYWAKIESPKGLQGNSLFGISTNQSILNGSRNTGLSVNDYVFFRPTQSEKIMAEMGEIQVIRNGKLYARWKTFIN